jgi:hypothetical protein
MSFLEIISTKSAQDIGFIGDLLVRLKFDLVCFKLIS